MEDLVPEYTFSYKVEVRSSDAITFISSPADSEK